MTMMRVLVSALGVTFLFHLAGALDRIDPSRAQGGTKQASAATLQMKRATPLSSQGSVGLTSKRRRRIRRVMAKERPRPTTNPTIARRIPSITSPMTSRAAAPSAKRMPNSFVVARLRRRSRCKCPCRQGQGEAGKSSEQIHRKPPIGRGLREEFL